MCIYMWIYIICRYIMYVNAHTYKMAYRLPLVPFILGRTHNSSVKPSNPGLYSLGTCYE